MYRAVVAARDPARLREAVASAWAAFGIEPDRLKAKLQLAHYRPRLRARMFVRVKVRREPPKRPATQYLYLQAYPTIEAARRRMRSVAKRPLRCIGPPVFLIEEWSSVAWALPNGPMLRTAKSLLRRPAYRRFLVEAGILDANAEPARGPRPPKLIRYVPRHRAVFRQKRAVGRVATPLYIKLYAPGIDAAAARNLALAREAAGDAFAVPPLVAHVARRRALVMGALPGRRLGDHDPSTELVAFEAAGRALAALHRSGVTTGEAWSAEREMSALRAGMDDVVSALPALRERVEALIRQLDDRAARLAFPADRIIHGNMFGDQVIVDEGSVGIVDWDDLCMGDPLYDVGRLVASTLFTGLRSGAEPRGAASLLSGYELGGGGVEHDRLRWHACAALLLRAKISALRQLPDTWIEDVARSVSGAESLLARRGELTP